MRPTDDVDTAMLTAVAKKAALEGAASVQRAASQREIIECSGAFATASKNGRDVNVWDMTVRNADDCSDDMNVAQIKVASTLNHDCAIQAITASKGRLIITGDVVGDVFLWKYMRISSFSFSKDWTKLSRFTPYKEGRLYTPQEKSEQSIVSLCVLEEGQHGGKRDYLADMTRFVAGSKGGKIRVWNITEKPAASVYKNEAISANVTSEKLADLAKLPPIKDPRTQDECLAFAVSSVDGHVAMALNPQTNELAVFDKKYCSPSIDETANESEVDPISIAVLGGTLISSDGNGDIHLSTPVWSPAELSNIV